MSTTIRCQKCGEQIEIDRALQKQLEQKVFVEVNRKHEQEISELKKAQAEVIAAQERELATKLEAETKKLRVEAIDKIRKEYDAKINSTKEESEEREKQNRQLQKQLSALMKQLRDSKDAEGRLKLQFEKQLLEEQDKIKQGAKREAEEEFSLKNAQKDKQIKDVLKANEELRRKLEQGSQQLQGEVLELQLEELFRREFPFDEIKEVPKGVRGADIIQIVKTRQGTTCGTIVWELKNTKNWSAGWVAKLKEDKRKLKAEVAVLVSVALPLDIRNFGEVEGVWVVNTETAISLAYVLREQLLAVQGIRLANQGKASKAELVYEYLLSNEFKARVEVWMEYFKSRLTEIEKEESYFNRKWEHERKSIYKVKKVTVGMWGDLEGLVGSSLPKMENLELGSGFPPARE